MVSPLIGKMKIFTFSILSTKGRWEQLLFSRITLLSTLQLWKPWPRESYQSEITLGPLHLRVQSQHLIFMFHYIFILQFFTSGKLWRICLSVFFQQKVCVLTFITLSIPDLLIFPETRLVSQKGLTSPSIFLCKLTFTIIGTLGIIETYNYSSTSITEPFFAHITSISRSTLTTVILRADSAVQTLSTVTLGVIKFCRDACEEDDSKSLHRVKINLKTGQLLKIFSPKFWYPLSRKWNYLKDEMLFWNPAIGLHFMGYFDTTSIFAVIEFIYDIIDYRQSGVWMSYIILCTCEIHFSQIYVNIFRIPVKTCHSTRCNVFMVHSIIKLELTRCYRGVHYSKIMIIFVLSVLSGIHCW